MQAMNDEAKSHLLDYLLHLQGLGIPWLNLERSPFAEAKGSIHPVTQLAAGQVPERAKPPAPSLPARPLAKPEQKAGALAARTPGVEHILDLLREDPPAVNTRQKAAAIRGEGAEQVLGELQRAFQNCQACALGVTRGKFVFGEGDAKARVLFVGEGPGAEEDASGRPFVGAAGQLLDRIIEAMGLERAQVYIANVVKCRPPGNRAPLPDETAACSPILERQIELISPEVVVALGNSALRQFCEGTPAMTRARGHFIQWKGFRIMPTYHPAYILRNPAAKREVWEDIKQVMALLGLKGKGG
jgi:DNA polymerase